MKQELPGRLLQQDSVQVGCKLELATVCSERLDHQPAQPKDNTLETMYGKCTGNVQACHAW